jgi:hypothetical protein
MYNHTSSHPGKWATGLLSYSLHTPPPTLTHLPISLLFKTTSQFMSCIFVFHSIFFHFLICFSDVRLLLSFSSDNFNLSLCFSFFLSVLSAKISFCFSCHYWPLLLYNHTVLYCSNSFYPYFFSIHIVLRNQSDLAHFVVYM